LGFATTNPGAMQVRDIACVTYPERQIVCKNGLKPASIFFKMAAISIGATRRQLTGYNGRQLSFYTLGDV
jgi:hypothetical protein